jgi:polyphosphate kinase 2 (PPK2 family)
MIVPTKTWKKDDYEIALMVFPLFEEGRTTYEFHLVKFFVDKNEAVKKERYQEPINIEKIAKDFGVKPEDVKELLEKLNYQR